MTDEEMQDRIKDIDHDISLASCGMAYPSCTLRYLKALYVHIYEAEVEKMSEAGSGAGTTEKGEF